MYRDDLAATHARVEQLQRELSAASSQTVQDQQRIAALTAQLAATQAALQRLGGALQHYQPYGASYIFPSRGGTVLTLGILSLVVCSVMGPIAWAMGNEELRRIESGQTSPDGRGSVVAGRVCGIISSVLLMFSAFIFLLALATVH
ncbi:MAG TPA: DUF4190 domain-containing protein [Kofleriaceae bacterium]|nr:DUF4190 domain-containing protein [Kofleriaceae bacterium]